MRMLGYSFYLLYMYVLVTGCVSQKTTASATNDGKYSEDLSVLRPKVEVPVEQSTSTSTSSNTSKSTQYVEPQFAINKKLDTVLDSIDQINLSRKSIQGFTIQVYSGKREEAINIKKQLGSRFPDVESEVQFTEPIFRVKAGKYYNRFDAQKDFMEIKEYFPAAIIVPDRIDINKL